MKKIVVLAVFLILGWLGFSFFSAYWARAQFTEEVDSLLQSPRDLSEGSLTPLILNKAGQFGITVDPQDVQIRIAAADPETTTSRLIEKRGLTAEVRILTLHMRYGQSTLGISRSYTLDRKRIFTAQAVIPTQTPSDPQALPGAAPDP